MDTIITLLFLYFFWPVLLAGVALVAIGEVLSKVAMVLGLLAAIVAVLVLGSFLHFVLYEEPRKRQSGEYDPLPHRTGCRCDRCLFFGWGVQQNQPTPSHVPPARDDPHWDPYARSSWSPDPLTEQTGLDPLTA